MKIAIEAQPLMDREMTGVGWYTYHIIKALGRYADSDHVFYLLGMDLLKDTAHLKRLKAANIHIKTNSFIHYGIYRSLWDYIPFMDYGRIFGINADAYHFFNFIVPPNVRGRVVVTVYDMVYRLFPQTMGRANYLRLDKNLKRSCQRADSIITISQNSRKEITDYLGVDGDKVHVISPGIDLERYKDASNTPAKAFIAKKYSLPDNYFLYLGTIEPRKNIKSIIEAFKILKGRYNTAYSLVIAGRKGWMFEGIFRQVKENQLEEDIIFPGYIEEADKPYVYSGARAFVFPSLYEGFGMPILEAMASGTPVITSNTSSMPEVAGDAGILVDPLDVEALSEAMYSVLSNDTLHESLVEKGLKQAAGFSWDRSARKLMAIYKALV